MGLAERRVVEYGILQVFRKDFHQRAKVILGEFFELEEDESVQRTVEQGIHVEADQAGVVVEVFLHQYGQPVLAVGDCEYQPVEVVHGLDAAEQLVGIDRQEIGFEGVGGRCYRTDFGAGVLLLQEVYREALVEVGKIVADADGT